MASPSSSDYLRLFRGAEIHTVSVGASSVNLLLDGEKVITFYGYGAIEDKEDWLYNLPLCGDLSVQSLVGERVVDISIDEGKEVKITLNEGRVIRIKYSVGDFDLVGFAIGSNSLVV